MYKRQLYLPLFLFLWILTLWKLVFVGPEHTRSLHVLSHNTSLWLSPSLPVGVLGEKRLSVTIQPCRLINPSIKPAANHAINSMKQIVNELRNQLSEASHQWTMLWTQRSKPPMNRVINSATQTISWTMHSTQQRKPPMNHAINSATQTTSWTM